MINGDLEQFLDTGWYTESTIFYKGHIYWCEGNTDFFTGVTHFRVDRWRAAMGKDLLYHSYLDEEGEPAGFRNVFDVTDKDMASIKRQFLDASLFGGLPFMLAEKEIAWLDEGRPVGDGTENVVPDEIAVISFTRWTKDPELYKRRLIIDLVNEEVAVRTSLTGTEKISEHYLEFDGWKMAEETGLSSFHGEEYTDAGEHRQGFVCKYQVRYVSGKRKEGALDRKNPDNPLEKVLDWIRMNVDSGVTAWFTTES